MNEEYVYSTADDRVEWPENDYGIICAEIADDSATIYATDAKKLDILHSSECALRAVAPIFNMVDDFRRIHSILITDDFEKEPTTEFAARKFAKNVRLTRTYTIRIDLYFDDKDNLWLFDSKNNLFYPAYPSNEGDRGRVPPFLTLGWHLAWHLFDESGIATLDFNNNCVGQYEFIVKNDRWVL